MRPTPAVAALFLVAASLTACARHKGAAPGAAHPVPAGNPSDTAGARLELTGVIVASGTEQFTITTLQREAHRPVRLVGELAGELRRLAGATVRVRGTRTTGSPSDAIDAWSYEVLSIDGQHPHVGTLLVRGDSVWLAAVDTLQLVAAPDLLRTQAGAKVWIIGPATPDGRAVRVQSYGVIRPAQP